MNVNHFGSQGGSVLYAAFDNVEENSYQETIVDDPYIVPDPIIADGCCPPCFNYDKKTTWNKVGQMASAAHMYDMKLLIKLGASFPNGKSLNGCDQPEDHLLFPIPEGENRICFMAQNPTPGSKAPTLEEIQAKIATKEELKEAIEDVARTSLKYKNAGFDGMSLRGDRWGLNASTNFRTDEYGGDIEGRGRFQLELFKRIKEVCGNDFIVEVVMPGNAPHGHDGHIPHGYTEEEFIRFIMMVEKYIDIVEIRETCGLYYQALCYASRPYEHDTLDYAKHLREAGFSKTIAVNGGYHDPEEFEKILGEGIVDVISTTRSFRADLFFLEKLRSHGNEVPTPCIRCNKCHGAYQHTAICSVNPKNSIGNRLPLITEEASKSKKVAIIGGGLAGMRTATFAAERGHIVTIFEKDCKLGGKAAYYAPLYPDQWTMHRYLTWLSGELKRRGVSDIRLNTEPTPAQLAEEGFDAVIACTGSREMRPPIDGADQEKVWLDEDVYFGNFIPGHKVVIVGGGDVATETAMYLASSGRDVTILTRSDILMKKESYVHGPRWGNIIFLPELGYGGEAPAWTKYDNLKPVYGAVTKHITPDSVTYEKDGEEFRISADTVVVSGGYKPCTDDALKYASVTDEFYMAGDVVLRHNNLIEVNRDALSRAIML